VQELLENHTMHLYSQRQGIKRPVKSQVFLVPLRTSDVPAFSSFRFERSTRAAARRILGETDAMDDLDDIPFTPNDIRHFDEKKRRAEELDKLF